MSSLSSLNYTDIIESCYSEDGKNLTKVNDTSPHLRISAKCELIQDKCFYQLNSLISFSFEDNPNLTIIGKESFYFCTKLSIINLSICNKLTKISNSAFYNCEEVTEILLPKGLIEINVAAFRYNIKLDHITIPASVEKIESQAFDTCFELTYVIFEEGSDLTSLERTAFYYTNISSFQIPEKVAYVHGWVFSNEKLTNLTIHPNNKHLIIENNNYVLSSNKSVLFHVRNKTFESYEIPDSVTTLGLWSFSSSRLKSIVLPSSLINIRESCFQYSKLTSITLPENVKRIENQAFYSCEELINVTFLGAVEFIGSRVFQYCKNLELIIFPNVTMTVSSDTFNKMYIPKLSMAFTIKTLFSYKAIDMNTNVSISFINKSDLIMTPNGLIMNSNQTEIYGFWGLYFSVTIPKKVTVLKEKAFENSDIYGISFEADSQLSAIENYAFINCSKLNSLSFPQISLNTIGIGSFIN